MNCGPPSEKAINFHSTEKDYQRVAREVFPVLIQLATDKTRPTISYGELAEKVGVTHIPQNRRGHWMRWPLGCIWQTLFEYQKDTDLDIPYLMTIVVNKNSDVPTIFKTYLNWSDEKIKAAQDAVYNFEHWQDVMEAICQT